MNTLIIELIQPFCTLDKHKLPLGLIFIMNKDELQLIKELLVDTAKQLSLSTRAKQDVCLFSLNPTRLDHILTALSWVSTYGD